MGRGHAYPYRYFMLVDIDHDYFYEHYEDGESEFSDMIWDDFLEIVKEKLYLKDYGWVPEGRNAYPLGETEDLIDTIRYAIDSSGGIPCLFAEVLYDNKQEYEEEIEECYEDYLNQTRTLICQSFNELIETFPAGVFKYPTSPWTSESYSTERMY